MMRTLHFCLVVCIHAKLTAATLPNTPFFSTSDPAILGTPNPLAASGNPLRGLIGGARWKNPTTWPAEPITSMEWYNVAFDEVFVAANTTNWSVLEQLLAGCASRNRHAVLSVRVVRRNSMTTSVIPLLLTDDRIKFFIHWPGQPLRLPSFLLETPDLLITYDTNQLSPDYSHPELLKALDYFLKDFAAKYDGDKRIGYIQQGLLGFWGEWHSTQDVVWVSSWVRLLYVCVPTNQLTFSVAQYPNDFIGEKTKDTVMNWFKERFVRTQIQARYPRDSTKAGTTVGIGRNDGSFTFNTLDGAYNGGGTVGWYFWPQTVAAGQTDFWKTHAMGGETRPENQDIVFKDSYPGGTNQKQWFIDCVNVTHATYMVHHNAYSRTYEGSELANANREHSRMGYNFVVTQVAAALSSISPSDKVDIEVTILQIGVAPFYYDLGLGLACEGYFTVVPGVEGVRFAGETRAFVFTGIPKTSPCLNLVTLSLKSSLDQGRPIKFAQGVNGVVSFAIPANAPAPSPVRQPTASPVVRLTAAPVTTAAPVPRPKVCMPDSTTWRDRFGNGCDWVIRSPSSRCSLDATANCHVACNSCDPSICTDSRTWRRLESGRQRDCNWVALSQTSRCRLLGMNNGTSMWAWIGCPGTCRTCA